jgi:hypothetical protein
MPFRSFRTCENGEKLVIAEIVERSIGVIVTVLPIPRFDPHRTTGAPSAVGSWSKAWALNGDEGSVGRAESSCSAQDPKYAKSTHNSLRGYAGR